MRAKGRSVDNSVCMILLGFRGEEVYDGCQAGFYVCECVEVYLYVDLYDDIYIYDGHDVVFCVLCLGTCI